MKANKISAVLCSANLKQSQAPVARYVHFLKSERVPVARSLRLLCLFSSGGGRCLIWQLGP